MACEGPFTVRSAEPDDASGIAAVHVASWRDAYRGILPDAFLDGLDVERRARFWREALATPDGAQGTWVALSGDTVVGFANVGPAREADAGPDVGELFAIYLDSPCWGRGLGRELMASAVEGLVEQGFRAATLWVLADNRRAIDFYRKAGWTADGTDRTEALAGVQVSELRFRRALGSDGRPQDLA